ncbi:hypothetical protein EDD15DRAFT_144532 [Pisolithus albus]|nr:hypothetical protein EDD15DRAFT_144532 [Pisolithus albus]
MCVLSTTRCLLVIKALLLEHAATPHLLQKKFLSSFLRDPSTYVLQPSHTIPSRKLHCAEHLPIACTLELYNPGGSNKLMTPSFEYQYYSHVIRMSLIQYHSRVGFPPKNQENVDRKRINTCSGLKFYYDVEN